MELLQRWHQALFGSCLILLSFSCTESTNHKFSQYEDTTVSVYGPYRVFKLPITKGIKILNPLHISTGPRGKIFSANQSGEVYSLIDSDDDGFEDESVLFCNVTDDSLRSPAG